MEDLKFKIYTSYTVNGLNYYGIEGFHTEHYDIVSNFQGGILKLVLYPRSVQPFYHKQISCSDPWTNQTHMLLMPSVSRVLAIHTWPAPLSTLLVHDLGGSIYP